MNRITALIEAAKAATPIETDLYGDRYFRGPYSQAILTKEQDRFFTLANPATILELCALLEKCKDALCDTEASGKHHDAFEAIQRFEESR